MLLIPSLEVFKRLYTCLDIHAVQILDESPLEYTVLIANSEKRIVRQDGTTQMDRIEQMVIGPLTGEKNDQQRR